MLGSNAAKAMAMSALLLIIVPMGSSGVSDDALTPEDVTALLELRLKVRDFEIWKVQEEAFRADLADDHVTISYRGSEYVIDIVGPLLTTDRKAPLEIGSDGTAKPVEDWVPSQSYRGTLEGAPDGRALLTVTKIGVDGYIKAPGLWLQFEPLLSFDNDASPWLMVVYKTSDLVMMEGDFEHQGPEELPVGPSEEEGFSILTHLDRNLWVFADMEFYNEYSSCWYCKVDNVMSRVQSVYLDHFVWKPVDVVQQACINSACNSNQGMTSYNGGDLRDEYAAYRYSQHHSNGGDETWEITHLFTGKDIVKDNGDDSLLGKAYAVGRYAVSQMVNQGSGYQGGSSNFEAGLLVSHEMGHNFDAWHPQAESYTHWHFIVPYTHYTIMWEEWKSGSTDEMVDEFSATNADWIDACNRGAWSSIPYSPGSYWSSC